jgi:hypothetical protein
MALADPGDQIPIDQKPLSEAVAAAGKVLEDYNRLPQDALRKLLMDLIPDIETTLENLEKAQTLASLALGEVDSTYRTPERPYSSLSRDEKETILAAQSKASRLLREAESTHLASLRTLTDETRGRCRTWDEQIKAATVPARLTVSRDPFIRAVTDANRVIMEARRLAQIAENLGDSEVHNDIVNGAVGWQASLDTQRAAWRNALSEFESVDEAIGDSPELKLRIEKELPEVLAATVVNWRTALEAWGKRTRPGNPYVTDEGLPDAFVLVPVLIIAEKLGLFGGGGVRDVMLESYAALAGNEVPNEALARNLLMREKTPADKFSVLLELRKQAKQLREQAGPDGLDDANYQEYLEQLAKIEREEVTKGLWTPAKEILQVLQAARPDHAQPTFDDLKDKLPSTELDSENRKHFASHMNRNDVKSVLEVHEITVPGTMDRLWTNGFATIEVVTDIRRAEP